MLRVQRTNDGPRVRTRVRARDTFYSCSVCSLSISHYRDLAIHRLTAIHGFHAADVIEYLNTYAEFIEGRLENAYYPFADAEEVRALQCAGVVGFVCSLSSH